MELGKYRELFLLEAMRMNQILMARECENWLVFYTQSRGSRPSVGLSDNVGAASEQFSV